MSETVKLIIEIPKDAYRACNALTTDDDQGILTFCVVNAVANGTPLDRNSELAEMQAYFSGMDYGWEKGRESLIDDVKAEIETDLSGDMFDDYGNETALHEALWEILDNVGKAESEKV